MATNNAINAPIPFSPDKGGTGVVNPAVNGILVGQGSSPIISSILNDGQILIGYTGSSPVATNITAGSGISVTNGPGSLTISSSGSVGLPWNDVTLNFQQTAPEQGYITNNGATLVTYLLPMICAQGEEIAISGFSLGGWRMTQNSGQQIIFGNTQTTLGVGGYLESTSRGDQLSLLCVTANLTWVVLRSSGNLTTA